MKLDEETLDPSDWDDISKVAHEMVDDMIEYLKTVGKKKIWQPITEESKSMLNQPLPQDGTSLSRIYKDFTDNILPYNMGNPHPRFWGWVIGNGTFSGALADFLASVMNPNQGGGNHVANYVEYQVLDWCKEMLNYPMTSSGILVSGGSMANLVGLTVARNSQILEVQSKGLFSLSYQYTVYGSTEMHSSIDKAIDLLGLGRENLRKIPVNDQFEINIEELVKTIDQDKKDGKIPICIIGNAGTVNTGATDDLEMLAEIAKKERIWYHVDGAFGAITKISPQTAHLSTGLEKADSIAFDLHKWMYMNYEIGVALVRDQKKHYQAFSYIPEYLARASKGVHSGDVWFSDYGLQLSRGFRSLKAWMSFREHGIQKYGRLIKQNIEQAKYLGTKIEEIPELEILAPFPMNIVCFRYKGTITDEKRLNKLNEAILIELHERGIAVPSYTKINGSYVIRVAITNHRSKFSDFNLLVEAVIAIAEELIEIMVF